MFGMAGDDLTIALFLVGTSISIASAAMSAAGWRHRVFIRSLFVIAGVFAVAGLAWLQIKDVSPYVTSIVQQIATHPVSWFVMLILVIAASLAPNRASLKSVLPPPGNEQVRSIPVLQPQPTQSSRPQLSPSEKDRLSNVLYGLAEILQKKGRPLVGQLNGISTMRRGAKPDVLKQRLLQTQDDFVRFRDELFQKFIIDHQYYSNEISNIVINVLQVNMVLGMINEYIIMTDQVIGLEDHKIETILSLTDNHMIQARTHFESWLNNCEDKIGAMRTSLR